MKKLILALFLFTVAAHAQISTSGNIPVGAVMQFDLTACPSGWLPRDGSCIDQVKYKNLYAAIGTRYAVTFGSCATGYFRIADARGLFNRAAGTNGVLTRANNAKYTGGSVGSYLGDAFQGHWHNSYLFKDMTFQAAGGTGAGVGAPDTLVIGSVVREAITDGTNGTPRTSSETRPASLSTLDCIKY